MANISPGRLVSLPEPMRTPPRAGWSARHCGNLLTCGGAGSISGRTYSAGAPAARRVVLLKQPPASAVLFEASSANVGATFDFGKLAPGNYLVLDCTLDGSKQALVFDWVVVA